MSSTAPDRLGPYRILETLGEGGMGTVYLAEQTEPIRRRVALKVIRPGVLRREVVRRFEVERQALARMNHPHIAQAYEAGETGDGQPYFVMEHVPGLPITRYCDEKRLTVGERLELFEAVCDGVQHLHQKGIIHRDLKPSNVLVAEERDQPVPKIIDFGIAKALDQPLTDGTVFTGERVIGTPAYLSPESIQSSAGGLDVDTRSDVYALGVLLFELLTGELPFGTRGDSFLEVARRITEEEPALASDRLAALEPAARAERAAARRLDTASHERRLRGDLDWVARKAMAKDRSRRYASAAELADDLRRHRRHQPVSASPPNAAYRAAKFVRRHRSGVAAALLVALALVGGTAARTLEAQRANREARRANEEAARANQEAEAAQQVSDFLVGLFEVSDPDQARGGETTARELLDRGAERVAGPELADQPLLQARLMDAIGSVYRKLGVFEPASELLQGALEIRRRHLGASHLDVAASHNNLGSLHWYRGDYAAAASHYESALAVREQILGLDHVDVAAPVGNLGGIYLKTGRFDLAEVYLQRALEIRERASSADDPDLGMSLHNLGTLYWEQGRLDEADPYIERALAMSQKTLGPDHPRVAYSLNNLAAIAFERGDYARAESLHLRCLSIWKKILEPNHSEMARTFSNLGEVYWKQGRDDEAERHFQRAREIWIQVGGPGHLDLAHALLGLANLYRDQGRHFEAEPLYRQALDIRTAALAADHPLAIETLEDYAAQLRATGREDEAARLSAEGEGTAEGGGRGVE